MLFNILLLLGCLKQPLKVVVPLGLDRYYGSGPDMCIKSLETEVRKTGCSRIMVVQTKAGSIMFRCYKADSQRGKFWDNYYFKLSVPNAVFSDRDDIFIKENIICVDTRWRVEAYPPHIGQQIFTQLGGKIPGKIAE